MQFKVRDFLADQTLTDQTIESGIRQLIETSLSLGYYNRLGLQRILSAKVEFRDIERNKALMAALREVVLDATVTIDDWEWNRVCQKLAPAKTIDDLLQIAEDEYVAEVDLRRYAALYFDLPTRQRTSEPTP